MKKLVKSNQKSVNEVSLYCYENTTRYVYNSYNVLGELDHTHERGCTCAVPKNIKVLEVPYLSNGGYCGFELYPGTTKPDSERLCGKNLYNCAMK